MIFAGMKCIGSGCMLWRWIIPVTEDEAVGMPGRKGHCGLAGKP